MKFRLDEFDLEIDIGTYAKQADGAVMLKQGGTVVLSTAVSAPSPEFPGFLPLTVDYREQFAAAGKIPGGYFKREGRSTTRETLTARLIDRSIRPLFPANYFDQIQVLSTVYSVDKNHPPQALGLLAASIALTTSKIPFMGPVGAVSVVRLDGKWIVNPTHEQYKAAEVNITVAGTAEGICMVEGSALEISEEDFVEALFLAHDKIKILVAWQEKIRKELNVVDQEIVDDFDWSAWEKAINAFFTLERLQKVFVSDKIVRSAAITELQDAFFAQHELEITEKEVAKDKLGYLFNSCMRDRLTDLIFKQGKRIDDRSYDQVRSISNEVGLLPFAHGSSVFTRGRTQALATVTLGSGQDVLRVEGFMEEEANKRFFLHYNFPPFSVGEVRFMRGPGRREIGHGNLAETALVRMLPTAEDFPYTLRIVVDILESDGSSSMATVCSSTMALLNAGVPMKKMVSGVAMGLLRSSEGSFQALTDISGFEDAFGLMDFKVCGTRDGITAIQMDIKYKGGLPREVFVQALAQAKKGREHILDEMQKVMSKPAAELSPLVPKVISFKISQDKIGAIIGPGGKMIREIIAQTGTSIDIEEDGTVNIFGGPDAKVDVATSWVKTLAGNISRGAIYHGRIRRMAEFGIFIELVPGVDGLLHVSNIPREQQRSFQNDYELNQEVDVEVVDYDPETERIRLRFAKK